MTTIRMNKNSRGLLNIGMVILLSIIIVILFSTQNDDTHTLTLSSLSLNEVTHIKIGRPNGDDILFIKQDNAIWYMIKPYHLKAHQFRINTLLSLTQIPVDKKYDTDSLDLSQYALGKPRATITFNNTEIRFGKTNSLNGKRYFLSEQKMTLIADNIYPLVSAQASSFIDLSILPTEYKITKIQTPTVSVLLDNNKTWINDPHATDKSKLNIDQIQTLLQNWNSAQAFAVHKYLARKQLGQIEIYSPTQKRIFQITDDDPWLILALPDINIEYHFDSSQKNNLLGIFNQSAPDA